MTRSEWKHGETRRLVERHYGTLQAEKAIRASHSVHWKLNIAAYHASEIKKMSKVVAPSQMEAVRKIFLHASGNKQAVGYVRVQFRMEAHLIACTQALHSIGDIISHVIWYGTGLGSTVPDKNKISLVGVINALETQEKAVGAMKALKCLRNSEAFTYLTAYVNTTKHRSLIDSRASASMNLSQPRHGFCIDSFCYRDIEYPKTWFDTISEEYRAFLQDAVVNIGNTLNDWLSNQTSSITRG